MSFCRLTSCLIADDTNLIQELNKWKDIPVYGYQDPVVLRCQVVATWLVDSGPSQSKPQQVTVSLLRSGFQRCREEAEDPEPSAKHWGRTASENQHSLTSGLTRKLQQTNCTHLARSRFRKKEKKWFMSWGGGARGEIGMIVSTG